MRSRVTFKTQCGSGSANLAFSYQSRSSMFSTSQFTVQSPVQLSAWRDSRSISGSTATVWTVTAAIFLSNVYAATDQRENWEDRSTRFVWESSPAPVLFLLTFFNLYRLRVHVGWPQSTLVSKIQSSIYRWVHKRRLKDRGKMFMPCLLDIGPMTWKPAYLDYPIRPTFSVLLTLSTVMHAYFFFYSQLFLLICHILAVAASLFIRINSPHSPATKKILSNLLIN